jgi:hypothetical protein
MGVSCNSLWRPLQRLSTDTGVMGPQLRRKQFAAFLHCLDDLQVALAAEAASEDGEAAPAPALLPLLAPVLAGDVAVAMET